MNTYTVVVSLHVVVAILGLGPLVALAVLTRRPALPAGVPRPAPPEPALRAFLRLTRLSQVSLALMAITGAIMIAMVRGAFGRQLWMAVAVVLFLILSAGSALVQRSFKKALLQAGSTDHVERAHRFLLVMSGLIVVIAWLMEAKPF